jgi:CRP-like cAMP-binding protein
MRKKVKTAFDPKKFLAKVGEGKTVSSYRKDQTVFSQGEIADAVFYIAREGQAHRRFQARQGGGGCNRGSRSFFGEGCLNGHPLRIATTRAVDDDCVITRLEKATMLATIHKEPEFSELFMSYLLTRNGRIEEDLIDQLFNSSEKRLARLLLQLAGGEPHHGHSRREAKLRPWPAETDHRAVNDPHAFRNTLQRVDWSVGDRLIVAHGKPEDSQQPTDGRSRHQAPNR